MELLAVGMLPRKFPRLQQFSFEVLLITLFWQGGCTIVCNCVFVSLTMHLYTGTCQKVEKEPGKEAETEFRVR